jgi:hypothetical protein
MTGEATSDVGGPAPVTDAVVRVVLIDDHDVVRLGLRALLDAAPTSAWSARPPTGMGRSHSTSGSRRTSS